MCSKGQVCRYKAGNTDYSPATSHAQNCDVVDLFGKLMNHLTTHQQPVSTITHLFLYHSLVLQQYLIHAVLQFGQLFLMHPKLGSKMTEGLHLPHLGSEVCGAVGALRECVVLFVVGGAGDR